MAQPQHAPRLALLEEAIIASCSAKSTTPTSTPKDATMVLSSNSPTPK
jgi:hypothetical protein